MQKLTILKLTGILLLFSFLALAQQTQAPLPTLESPSNTMNVHLYYLQQDSYRPEIAARCINLPGDSLQAMQLALQLKQIFDGKGLFVRLNMLPQEPDYRDTITQKPYYTPFPEQLPDVSYGAAVIGPLTELVGSASPLTARACVTTRGRRATSSCRSSR